MERFKELYKAIQRTPIGAIRGLVLVRGRHVRLLIIYLELHRHTQTWQLVEWLTAI